MSPLRFFSISSDNFFEVEAALTSGPEASPPFNMQRAVIFIGALCCATGCLAILCLRGLPDSRRAMDKAKEKDARPISA